MARKPSPTLTQAELELMEILWKHGPSTVQMVADHLPPDRPLAYTTVQTVLNTLHRKGKVERTLQKRAFYYGAAVSRAGAAAQAVKDMVRTLFGGSPEKLILTMLETQQLTPEKLSELQQLVKKAEEEER